MRILTQSSGWGAKIPATLRQHSFMTHDFKLTPAVLHQLCVENNIDVILSVDHVVQSDFAKQRQVVQDFNIPWLLPTYSASQIEDKFNFMNWMHTHGYTNYLPASRELDEYPVVVKTGNGHGGKFVHVINGPDDLSQLQIDWSSTPYVAQEYLFSDHEFTYQFIAINGKVKKQVTYKHMFSEQVAAKETYVRGRSFYNTNIDKHILDLQHQQVLNAIISQLNYTGWGDIDFKIVDNKLKIFEFNARVGGSIIFYDSCVHDFDEFLDVYKTALNVWR